MLNILANAASSMSDVDIIDELPLANLRSRAMASKLPLESEINNTLVLNTLDLAISSHKGGDAAKVATTMAIYSVSSG